MKGRGEKKGGREASTNPKVGRSEQAKSKQKASKQGFIHSNFADLLWKAFKWNIMEPQLELGTLDRTLETLYVCRNP